MVLGMFKIIATSDFVIALECNAQNSFSARDPPRTLLEELTALPRPSGCLKGPTSRGGAKRESGEERGNGRKEKGKGIANGAPCYANSWISHCKYR